MKISVGADDGGFDMKLALAERLSKETEIRSSNSGVIRRWKYDIVTAA